MKIIIRQDCAKPHNSDGSKAFFARHGQLYGWNIEVDTQCAQSPDVDILDIGVFAGMQARSEEYRIHSSTVDKHYRLIRICEGGNKFPNPHCGIRRRVTKGLDPVNYSIHFDDGYDTEDDE